jgi:hypothetical protein
MRFVSVLLGGAPGVVPPLHSAASGRLVGGRALSFPRVGHKALSSEAYLR